MHEELEKSIRKNLQVTLYDLQKGKDLVNVHLLLLLLF